MGVLTVGKNGYRLGVAPLQKDLKPKRAGAVNKGWTPGVVRYYRNWLYSVDLGGLAGYVGYSINLTVRDCPPSAAAWHKGVKELGRRLKRYGIFCGQWLVEWQPRTRHGTGSVPHLHGHVWFPPDVAAAMNLPALIVNLWLDIMGVYLPGVRGQNVKMIYRASGWFDYLAKHASKGYGNYQRDAVNIPAGWVSTGGMWGKWGKFPIKPLDKYYLSMPEYHRLRRWLSRYQFAHYRAAYNALGDVKGRPLLTASDKRRGKNRRQLKPLLSGTKSPRYEYVKKPTELYTSLDACRRDMSAVGAFTGFISDVAVMRMYRYINSPPLPPLPPPSELVRLSDLDWLPNS